MPSCSTVELLKPSRPTQNAVSRCSAVQNVIGSAQLADTLVNVPVVLVVSA